MSFTWAADIKRVNLVVTYLHHTEPVMLCVLQASKMAFIPQDLSIKVTEHQSGLSHRTMLMYSICFLLQTTHIKYKKSVWEKKSDYFEKPAHHVRNTWSLWGKQSVIYVHNMRFVLVFRFWFMMLVCLMTITCLFLYCRSFWICFTKRAHQIPGLFKLS